MEFGFHVLILRCIQFPIRLLLWPEAYSNLDNTDLRVTLTWTSYLSVLGTAVESTAI